MNESVREEVCMRVWVGECAGGCVRGCMNERENGLPQERLAPLHRLALRIVCLCFSPVNGIVY